MNANVQTAIDQAAGIGGLVVTTALRRARTPSTPTLWVAWVRCPVTGREGRLLVDEQRPEDAEIVWR